MDDGIEKEHRTLMSENAPYAVPSMLAAKAAKYRPALCFV